MAIHAGIKSDGSWDGFQWIWGVLDHFDSLLVFGINYKKIRIPLELRIPGMLCRWGGMEGSFGPGSIARNRSWGLRILARCGGPSRKPGFGKRPRVSLEVV